LQTDLYLLAIPIFELQRELIVILSAVLVFIHPKIQKQYLLVLQIFLSQIL